MIDFILRNKEWLFSGIGVSILTSVIFLVRYVVIRQRRPTAQMVISQVVQSAATAQASQGSPHDQGFPLIESLSRYLSHPTPKGISEELARLPPFQRTAAENNFIGICVKCNLSLSLVHTRDNDKVVLSCHAEGYSRYVSIATSLAQYPEIRIAKRGQAITVFGVITGIESSGPQVEAHRLEFE